LYACCTSRRASTKRLPRTITETSRLRLKDSMSMLLDPITETSSSIVKCFACRIVGARYSQIFTPARSSPS
jgi:hypothetical protein